MSMYQVAIMENSEGDKQYVMTCNGEKFATETENLRSNGFLMKRYFKTTNRAFYCKIRCQVLVSELRELESNRMNAAVELNKAYGDTNPQVIRDTEKMYEELEEAQINRVARAYARFLRANTDGAYEYADELVTRCYNYRESRMRLDSQIANEIYRKDPYWC